MFDNDHEVSQRAKLIESQLFFSIIHFCKPLSSKRMNHGTSFQWNRQKTYPSTKSRESQVLDASYMLIGWKMIAKLTSCIGVQRTGYQFDRLYEWAVTVGNQTYYKQPSDKIEFQSAICYCCFFLSYFI